MTTRPRVILDFECPTGCGACCHLPGAKICQPYRPDGNCRFLTDSGCRLPREKRPVICREYLCNSANTFGTEAWVVEHLQVRHTFRSRSGDDVYYVLDRSASLFTIRAYRAIDLACHKIKTERWNARKVAEELWGATDVTPTYCPGSLVTVGGVEGCPRAKVVVMERPNERSRTLVEFLEGPRLGKRQYFDENVLKPVREH